MIGLASTKKKLKVSKLKVGLASGGEKIKVFKLKVGFVNISL